MKKLFLPFIMALVLTSCSTYQYSSRTVDVRNRSIGAKETAVEVVADYSRTVSATSDYQRSKSEAVKEAEYRCILDNKIDVLVDPVFKVEFSPISSFRKYRATVTGYAGMYKTAHAGVDQVQSYTKEEIEKYKLLTDPSFPQYYYNNGTGDSYYINSSTGQVVKSAASGKSGSLAFAPKVKAQKVKTYDFFKASQLRKRGMILTLAGVTSMFVIGIPCISTAESEVYVDGYYGGYYDYTYNEAQYSAGAAFTTIGAVAILSGLPMWCVGSYRMKRSGNDTKVSVGGTKQGVGVRLNF